MKTVWVKAHGGSNPSSSANKTDKPFACPFCLMHYVRGIRTRALRKRHGASFLAAARRLLQSIKTADQGCFAKDKNESLFLRHKKPDKFCRVFCCFGRVILRNKIRGPRGILCTRGEKEHTSKRVSIIACNNVISKAQCATRTRLRRRTPYHGAARKRREKQALAFAKIERSGHSQQPDTKCQMQGISANARLLSVDVSLM